MTTILGEGWFASLWPPETLQDSTTAGRRPKTQANAVWKKLHDFVKYYTIKYVLTPRVGDAPTKTNDKVPAFVNLVYIIALWAAEWPLTDVVLERLNYEEERIRQVRQNV